MQVPKPKFKRSKPKRGKRGEFSKGVRQQIYERDAGVCQICAMQGEEIHHSFFKSQGGRGVYTNGILLCRHCHTMAHKHFDVAENLRERMRNRYGDQYYMDEYDKE